VKKLILVASLAVVAVIVAPIASANAAVTGACTVHGQATFTGGKLNPTPEKLGYAFAAKEGEVTCHETSGAEHKGSASVTGGNGTLSCGAAVSETEGEGTLTLPGVAGSPFHFKLSFVAAAGVVGLLIKSPAGTPEATGAASFAKSTKEEAKLCASPGVTELEFDAVTAGTIG
jgi:hypothetical protein